MQVNLKKAASLAAALSALTVKTEHTLGVDVYADVPTENMVQTAKENLKKQVETALNISTAAYLIRGLISVANEGRINKLLGDRALVEKQLSILNAVPVRAVGTSLVALGRQIEAQRAGGNDAARIYGGRGGLSLELETASLVTPIVRNMRRIKRNLDDELQAVNFATTIELPKEVVEVLTELDLI